MFGFGQKKNKTDKRKKTQKLQVSCNEGHKKLGMSDGQSLAGDALRAQALANARKARETIGEETVQKIAAAITKKESSPLEQAKARLTFTCPQALTIK